MLKKVMGSGIMIRIQSLMGNLIVVNNHGHFLLIVCGYTGLYCSNTDLYSLDIGHYSLDTGIFCLDTGLLR